MMFKTLFLISFLLATKFTSAAVTAQWMTVTSVALNDGKTKFLIDAAWTRPGILQWLNIKNFPSDEKLVSKILKEAKLEDLSAVFASHSHFDHAVDVPMVAKLTGATFYTDESSENLGKAYHDPAIKMKRITSGEKIVIGNFTIIPLLRSHPKILHLFDFLPGNVPADTQLGFWDYHTGQTWFYIILHPEGTILLDQGTESHVELVLKYIPKIDALLQGFANRKNDEDILNGYVKFFKPKVYLPLHFDNFFGSFESKDSLLPGVKFDGIMEKLKEENPGMNLIHPKYAEEVKLL